jgi:hypothetical protein
MGLPPIVTGNRCGTRILRKSLPSLDFSRSLRERDPCVHDFVDDHGFLIDDEVELVQLENFFKNGSDIHPASPVAIWRASLLHWRVIPSLDEFMEGG